MMFKLPFLIVIIVAVASLATGVLEVRVHPDKLASAPGDLVGYVSNGVLLERARVMAISAKRIAELYSAQTENKKLEVAVGFVRQDAARLEKLIASKPNIEKLVPQTELLAKSITKARTLAKDVSEGDLADLRAISEEAFDAAGGALDKLAVFQQELQTSSDQLTNILEDVVPDDGEGEVAGVKDEDELQSSVEEDVAAPEPVSDTSIPLRF